MALKLIEIIEGQLPLLSPGGKLNSARNPARRPGRHEPGRHRESEVLPPRAKVAQGGDLHPGPAQQTPTPPPITEVQGPDMMNPAHAVPGEVE